MPLDLAPVNTLFVTEQEFLRGNTSSETSSGQEHMSSPGSLDSSGNIPQFDIKSAMLYQVAEERTETPERPSSATPKASNKCFDFSDYKEEEDYLVFDDHARSSTQPPSPNSHMRSSTQFPSPRSLSLRVNVLPPLTEVVTEDYCEMKVLPPLTEVDTEDYCVISQDFSGDSSISTKEDRLVSPPVCIPPGSDSDGKEDEVLVAMRDTILKQQENLGELATKNTQYRYRLAASHGRVQELRKDHLGSMDAIIKLQFERESFEAEAVWLREELKTIRNELNQLNKTGDSEQEEGTDDAVQRMTSKQATSEVRWTRAQQFFQDLQCNIEERDRQLVEEPKSPSNAPLSSLRQPKHSARVLSSVKNEEMQCNTDSDSSHSSEQKKSVRFNPPTACETVQHDVPEQEIKLLASPTNESGKSVPSRSVSVASTNRQLQPDTEQPPSCEEATKAEPPIARQVVQHVPDQKAKSPASPTESSTESKNIQGVPSSNLQQQSSTQQRPSFVEAVEVDSPIAHKVVQHVPEQKAKSPASSTESSCEPQRNLRVSSWNRQDGVASSNRQRQPDTQQRPSCEKAVEVDSLVAHEVVQYVPEEVADLESPIVREPVQHVLEQKTKTSRKWGAPRNSSVSSSNHQHQEVAGLGALKQRIVLSNASSNDAPNPSGEEVADLVAFKQRMESSNSSSNDASSPQKQTADYLVDNMMSPRDRYLAAAKKASAQKMEVSKNQSIPKVQHQPRSPQVEPEHSIEHKTNKAKPQPFQAPQSVVNSPPSSVSSTGETAVRRKSTHRVRNCQDSSPSELKRQYQKVKEQAAAPTMSYAEANAELRWVKSQQRVLENMREDVASSSSGGGAQTPDNRASDPKDVGDLNRRVDELRMKLIKANADAAEGREEGVRMKLTKARLDDDDGRDECGMERDDLAVKQHGRQAAEPQEPWHMDVPQHGGGQKQAVKPWHKGATQHGQQAAEPWHMDVTARERKNSRRVKGEKIQPTTRVVAFV